MDPYRNAPRLRNRTKLPGQWAVMFAKMDYAFFETCLAIEMQGPTARAGSVDKLIEEDRILDLMEVRVKAENVLLAHGIPAANWVENPDDFCRGR